MLARRGAEADCPPAAFPSRIPRFEPRARASSTGGYGVGWAAMGALGLAAASAIAWLTLELSSLPLLG